MKRIILLINSGLLLISLGFSTGCDKASPIETAPVGTDTTRSDPAKATGRSFTIGSGTGKISIDGRDFKVNGKAVTLQSDDTIKIKKGHYEGITIKNIKINDGKPLIITNSGLVEIEGEGIDNVSGSNHQLLLSNLSNVAILGNGHSELPFGFLLHNNRFRAVQLEGIFKHFSMAYFQFKDLGDNVIGYDPNDLVYDGSATSYSEDLRFQHIRAENIVELIDFRGNINPNSDQNLHGLIKHIEISDIQVKNSPKAGTIVHLHNAQDFDIHHITLTDINTQRTDHVGIFTVYGPGKIHHNYVNSGWGNAVRAFPVSLGQNPGQLLIHDNIVVNSIKYGAFEVQPAQSSFIAGKTTFVNVKIFNNTCGNLNLQQLVVGKIVDTYDLFGGTYAIFNNLAFHFPRGGHDSKGPFVSYLSGDPAAVKLSDNLYFETYTAAGIIDEQSLKLKSNSPAKNKGKSDPLITYDYYGNPHGAHPSIGAVQ